MLSVKLSAAKKEFFHIFYRTRALDVCVCVCACALHKHTEQSRKEETPFSFVRVLNKKK
jgi:hypothetical protein